MLDKMALLSAEYYFEDDYQETLYAKYSRILQMRDDSSLKESVRPLYLEVSGEVLFAYAGRHRRSNSL